MKEHFQDYGIRKWAGNDLIELQSEPLEALQKLVEPYAPCIIQGCEVTENGDTITIAPGLVALQGKDYKGEDCVKIARFAGIADEKPPVYLILECEPDKRVYGDSKSKAIAYHYRAVATTQKPEKPYLKINADGNKRLVDTLGITQKLDREEAQKGIVSFTKDNAEKHTNIQSGSTLGSLFGKIERWFDDLKDLAFKSKVSKSDFDADLTTAFNNKVDKDGEKVLSECDFSQAEKEKLRDIAKGAEVNVQSDWDETNTASDAFIKNKPGNATEQTAGFMSKDDKKKLDSLEIGLDGFSIYRIGYSLSGSNLSGYSISTYFPDTVLNGRTLQVGDLFIEASETSYLYRIIAVNTNTWSAIRLISLRGAKGATGDAGAPGAEGLGIWRSSTATSSTTSSIALSTISIPTGRSVKVGDLIIANSTYSYLYRVTAVLSTTATVTYLTSLRGAQGAAGTNATTTAVATTSTNGLMSAADKTKLEGIADGANNYTHPTTAGNKHIPNYGSSGQYLKYSAQGTAAWASPASNLATTSAAGFMSDTDKKKLDGAYIYYMAKADCNTEKANISSEYNPEGVGATFSIVKSSSGNYVCKINVSPPAGYKYVKPMILGGSSGSAWIDGDTGKGAFNVYIMGPNTINNITIGSFNMVLIAHN